MYKCTLKIDLLTSVSFVDTGLNITCERNELWYLSIQDIEEDALHRQKKSNLIPQISCYLGVRGQTQSIELWIWKEDTIKGL